MRVLVVEDHPTVQAVVRDQLEELGAEVVVADSGDAAWEAARSQRFDMALVDMVLRDTDGVTLCRRLRETYRCRKALLMSGYPGWFLQSREMGATADLVKPFTISQLAAALGLSEQGHAVTLPPAACASSC